MNRVTDNVSGIGTAVSFVLAVLSAVLCIVGLFGMLAYAGGIGHSKKYTEMKHQEYLVKNPEHEVWAGKHQLSRFKNVKYNTPMVVTIRTSSAQYEAFVDGSDKRELIGNELLVSINDS